MRRTLILMALLGAGGGESRTADPPAPAGGVHAIAALQAAIHAPFLRSAPGTLPAAWQEGSGPAPRTGYRRPCVLPAGEALAARPSARDAAFGARATAHRSYAASHALSRAGLTSFNTATPPPSQGRPLI